MRTDDNARMFFVNTANFSGIDVESRKEGSFMVVKEQFESQLHGAQIEVPLQMTNVIVTNEAH